MKSLFAAVLLTGLSGDARVRANRGRERGATCPTASGSTPATSTVTGNTVLHYNGLGTGGEVAFEKDLAITPGRGYLLGGRHLAPR